MTAGATMHRRARNDTASAGSLSYYSIGDVAQMLGVSRVSVWRWIRSGRLPASRLGHRTVRIKHDDVELLTHSGRHRVEIRVIDPSSPSRSGALQNASEHVVVFYDADPFVIDSVVDFIGAAVRDGQRGVVVATPAHTI